MTRTSTGVYLYVPAIFSVTNFPSLRTLGDEAHSVLHKICALHSYFNDSADMFENIGWTSWKKSIHPSKVQATLTALLIGKVIERDGIYWPKVVDPIGRGKPLGYRLAEPYRGTLRRVEVVSRRFAAKLLAHRIRYRGEPISEYDLDAVHRHLLDWLRRTRIDHEAAYTIVDGAIAQPITLGKRRRGRLVGQYLRHNEARRAAMKLTVDQVRHSEADFAVCRYGRVHTPITRMFSGAREALSINGHGLINLDVRNSQVVFLALLMIEHYGWKCQDIANCNSYGGGVLAASLPAVECGVLGSFADAFRFIALVVNGVVYDHLMSLSGSTDRSGFKSRFFADVLYGDDSQRYTRESPLARLFATEFPTVHRFIRMQKRDNYANLARLMQIRESDFIIGAVCGRLLRDYPHVPILTIHDSILTPEAHANVVQRIMMEEFRRLGIEPSISRTGEHRVTPTDAAVSATSGL